MDKLTLLVKDCDCRFTRVVEHGGTYCHACGHEKNIDGSLRPETKPLEVKIDEILLQAEFRRNEIGTRLLTLSSPNVRGRWAGRIYPTSENWQPGILAALSLKDGVWDAHFGEWWAGFGDDSLLVRDAMLTARFLNLPAGERMDFTSPSTGDLERGADALGLRLPRMAARPGHVESYGRFLTLAEYIAALARPKAAGATNLRAGNRLPDEVSEAPDGRMLAT